MAQIIPIRPDAVDSIQEQAGSDRVALSSERARIEAALKKVAGLIERGEDWVLPLFVRLEEELEALYDKEDAITRALRLAR